MDYINFVHQNGYGVFPIDLEPDFVVGMGTGHARVSPAQRLTEIERELSASARFLRKVSFRLR